MNTKNIFRTLFMAVLLLVGASSANATEHIVWTGNAQSRFSLKETEAEIFESANVGDVIRFYCSYSDPYSWALSMTSPNYQQIENSLFAPYLGSTLIDGEYFEFEITEKALGQLNESRAYQGLYIEVTNLTLTKIVLITNANTSGFSIKVSTNGHGTVTADKNSAEEGEVVTLTISADSGYELESISAVDANGDNVVLEGSGGTRTFEMPASNVTVSAKFTRNVILPDNEIELWDGVSPAATWNGSNEYNLYLTDTDWLSDAAKETKIRVYADKENNNWKLYVGKRDWDQAGFSNANGEMTQYWDGDSYVSDGGYFEFVFGDQTATNLLNAGGFAISFHDLTIYKISYIKVKSGADTYTVNMNSMTNGTVTANPAKAAEGATVTLNISPYSGYELDAISVVDGDGNAVTLNGTGNTRTFTMPASDVTIYATFKIAEYSISVSNISNGTVTADATTATMGTTITLTITPDSGYELGTLSVKDANGGNVTVTNNQFTMPGSDVTVSATFNKLPAETTIGSTGYATFCSTENLDFRNVSGVKAYYAKEVTMSGNEGKVTLVQVTGTVAAGTGLVLVGSEGTYSVPVASSGNSISGNLLVGVTSSTQVMGENKYVLTVENNVVKFASTANQMAIVPANHAYLELRSSSSRAYSRIVVTFSGETTGIADRTIIDQEANVYYDLRGMRVEKPTHGLYIINGKKVFVK